MLKGVHGRGAKETSKQPHRSLQASTRPKAQAFSIELEIAVIRQLHAPDAAYFMPYIQLIVRQRCIAPLHCMHKVQVQFSPDLVNKNQVAGAKKKKRPFLRSPVNHCPTTSG